MKNRKQTTLVVILALVAALATVFGLAACDKTPEYTVSYVGGAGATGEAPAPQKVKDGTSVTLAENTFAKEHYTFSGWSDGTTAYQAGGSYTVNNNVTFTAVWDKEVTVAYAAGDGVVGIVPEASVHGKGTKITLPGQGNLSKAFYTFAGWTDGTNTYAAGSEYTVSGDVTLTAAWSVKKFTVSYNAGGAEGNVPSAQNADYNTSVTLAAVNGLTKTGYTFSGWSDGEKTYAAGNSYTVKSRVILTAQWTINRYTVTYAIGDGATGTAPAAQQADYNKTVTLATADGLNKGGKNFAGWSDGETTYAAGTSYTVVNNVTLTAVWGDEATVTYAAGDDATGNAPAAVNSVVGAPITLSGKGSLVKTNYTFAGWSDGTNIYAASSKYIVAGNVTLTAQWTLNKYNVTFSLGSGVEGTAPAKQSVEHGSKITLPSADGLIKTGYTFAGWKTGTTTLNAGDEYTVEKTTAFTAQWTANKYTVTYTVDDGVTGTAPAAQETDYSKTITLATADGLTKTGYAFVGWTDGEKTYAAGANYTVTGNVTLTALWGESTVVTFAKDADVSGEAPASVTCGKGSVIQLPSADGMAKEDCKFVGWSVSGSSERYKAGASYTVEGSVTLTAVFVEVTAYTEHFTSNEYSKITAEVREGKLVIFGQNNGEAVYTMTKSEDVYTFTLESCSNETNLIGTAYTGWDVNGVIVARLPVAGYVVQEQILVLSADELTFASGISGTAQSSDWKGKLGLYGPTQKIAVLEYNDWDTDSYTWKFGTYTLSNGLYSVTYKDGTSETYKLEADNWGSCFYVTGDAVAGSYTLGNGSITLNGFGTWDRGDYIAFTSGSSSMVYLNDEEELTTTLYKVSGNSLVEMSGNAGEYILNSDSGEVKAIYFDGEKLVGVVTTQFGNFALTLIGGSASYSPTDSDYSFDFVYDTANKQFMVSVDGWEGKEELIYTLDGKEPVEGTHETTLETGTYVNNLDSSVTATLTENSGVYTLTLTKDGKNATYTVTRKDGTLTITANSGTSSTPKDCCIYNGVIFAKNIKAGSSNVMIALSKDTALTSVEGMSAGYATLKSNSSEKVYLFTNNVAVYTTGAYTGNIGTYTVNSGIYSISYNDGTSAEYKLFTDVGNVKAYCAPNDGLAGTYTFGSTTIVLDGYGEYSGTKSGKYASGPNGFAIYEYGVITGKYIIDKTDNTLTEAEATVYETSSGGGSVNTTGSSVKTILEERGISFAGSFKGYTGAGCAEVTYTVTDSEGNKVTTTVTIAVGDVLEIEGIMFTVTKCNDTDIAMSCNIGGTVRSVYYNIYGAAG